MKRAWLIAAAALALTAAPIMAQNYMGDAPEALALRKAYLSAGKAFPLTRFPVSAGALREAAERLPEPQRSMALSSLPPARPAAPSYAVEGSAAYELKLKSAAIARRDPATGYAGFDTFKDYLEESDPLRLSLGGRDSRGWGVELGVVAKREFRRDDPRPDNLPELGRPGDPVALDNMIYWQGVVDWSDGEARVALGRDRLHLGPGPGSSLIHAATLPYIDALTMTLPVGRFRLDWVVSTIIPYKAYGIDDVDVDPAFAADIGAGHSGFITDENPSIIFNNVHRFEWLGERVRAAVSGQVILTRRNNMFTIGDFLPVSIWHNADIAPNNMILTFDFSWAPLPGLAINAIAGFDDIGADAFGVADDDIPTIDAYILSAEWLASVGRAELLGFLELGYTHYLWGNFDAKATMGSIDKGLLARAVGRYQSDGGAVLLPLTSPFGPGAAWAKAELSLGLGESPFSLRAEALVLSTNDLANLISTEFKADPAVRDAPRSLLIELGLAASARLGDLSLTFRPGMAHSKDGLAGTLALTGAYRFGMER